MNQISSVLEGFASQQGAFPLGILLVFALLAGLLSSLSPCVLSLLPLNLAYIGTSKIDNKAEALQKASLFVLGVSIVLALIGAFGSVAFAIFSQYKGIIHTVVGAFIILMALMVMDVIKLPMPQLFNKVPDANPLVVGMVFALVSSPCSSPVLFAVLSAASSLGSVSQSVIVMFFYSIGYTAIIFFASLFAGLIKQFDWFKANNQVVMRVSGAVLALLGAWYLYIGIKSL